MGYPGGKNGAGVFQRIINLMPPHDVYIEPFLGGGAVLRLKRPARLNIGLDLDRAAVSTLASFGAARAASFSASRDLLASFSEPVPGGSGIARSREGRSPLAGTGDIRRRAAALAGNDDSAGGRDLHARNSDADLHARNGEAVEFRFLRADGIRFLERYRFTGSEVVYCDPPYVRSTRGRDLYRFEMTDVDHRHLLRVIRKIPARVLISGYWSEMYASALKSWNRITFEAMTRGGHTATEWLWFNFEPPAALHDYRYLGENFREREKLKRKKLRWTERLKRMPVLDRQALLLAIASIDV